MITPNEGETVEVLFNGKWLRARYMGADAISSDDDEIWWMNHFVLEDPADDEPDTLPEDRQQGGPLPEWRRAGG